MRLEAATVEAIFMDSLFQQGEDTTERVEAEGIMTSVGFHPKRLASHEGTVHALLLKLPEDFHAGKGGGMSFLNACDDHQGRQWTGEHRIMEQLVLLGLATGHVSFPMPRELWSALPGAMPYFVVAA